MTAGCQDSFSPRPAASLLRHHHSALIIPRSALILHPSAFIPVFWRSRRARAQLSIPLSRRAPHASPGNTGSVPAFPCIPRLQCPYLHAHSLGFICAQRLVQNRAVRVVRSIHYRSILVPPPGHHFLCFLLLTIRATEMVVVTQLPVVSARLRRECPDFFRRTRQAESRTTKARTVGCPVPANLGSVPPSLSRSRASARHLPPRVASFDRAGSRLNDPA